MKVTRKDIAQASFALKTIFTRPTYLLLASVIAVLILILAIWLPNLSFVTQTALSSSYSVGEKVTILWASLGAIQTNFTFLSRTFTILVAVLTGVNITMFVYYLKRRFRMEKSAGTSIAGMLVGLLGVGCAACGSVILSSIFGLGATASFIGLFPLRGSEFGILGVVLLLWANYSLAKKIQQPLVCAVKK
ncbi:hypothetical protein IH979_02795 [Patescibacteria group bacterium]|nr:hypothetical protein [Patescibacteria group bacterium]